MHGKNTYYHQRVHRSDLRWLNPSGEYGNRAEKMHFRRPRGLAVAFLYLDLYFPCIIYTAFLVNRYSTCAERINTLLRLPKPACSHPLRFPSTPFDEPRRKVNRFYMVEQPRLYIREEHIVRVAYVCTRSRNDTKHSLQLNRWIS